MTPNRPTASDSAPAGQAAAAYTTFITTITAGTSATFKPTDCARSSRNASENRASVNSAAIATMIQ